MDVAQPPAADYDWRPDQEAEQYERDLDAVLGEPWWQPPPIS